jgi:hypothetical protein
MTSKNDSDSAKSAQTFGELSGDFHTCLCDVFRENSLDVGGFVLGNSGARCSRIVDAMSGMFCELGPIVMEIVVVRAQGLCNARMFPPTM